jgi:hypothetical protein
VQGCPPVLLEEAGVREFATGHLLGQFYGLFGPLLRFNATSMEDIGLVIFQTASLYLLYKAAITTSLWIQLPLGGEMMSGL